MPVNVAIACDAPCDTRPDLDPERADLQEASPSRCRWCVIQATSRRAPSSAESRLVMSLLRSAHRPERRSS